MFRLIDVLVDLTVTFLLPQSNSVLFYSFNLQAKDVRHDSYAISSSDKILKRFTAITALLNQTVVVARFCIVVEAIVRHNLPEFQTTNCGRMRVEPKNVLEFKISRNQFYFTDFFALNIRV